MAQQQQYDDFCVCIQCVSRVAITAIEHQPDIKGHRVDLPETDSPAQTTER